MLRLKKANMPSMRSGSTPLVLRSSNRTSSSKGSRTRGPWPNSAAASGCASSSIASWRAHATRTPPAPPPVSAPAPRRPSNARAASGLAHTTRTPEGSAPCDTSDRTSSTSRRVFPQPAAPRTRVSLFTQGMPIVGMPSTFSRFAMSPSFRAAGYSPSSSAVPSSSPSSSSSI